MAKYTSDTNLIRGAAAVGQSMMPTDLSGLDKVTQAGVGMMGEAVKRYEAEQKKLEQEAREAQAKADKLNNDWNTLASGVYESAGSFMKDVEYKDTVASVKALRQEYIDAQNSKDAEKMAEVKIKFNNINTEVAAHKEFRANLTHPEYGMSDFVKGDKLEYMNKFIDEDYVIGRNDKGEKTYTIDGVSKTMEEINKMVGVKNMKPYGDYGKLVNDFSTSKTKGNRNSLELGIRNSIVPDQTNPLRAFLNDKGFGNGQTFSDLLNADGNKASIEKEIMNTIFDDGDGVITQTEYDNFVNAIVSPDNPFWKDNGGETAWKNQARRIATEQLANGAENAWDNNPDNILDNSGGDGDDDSSNNFGFGQFRVKTGGGGAQPKSITAATASQRRAYLDGLGQVDGEHGQYIWNQDLNNGQGMYVRQDDGLEMSMFDVARDEGLVKPGENKNNFNPKTQKTSNLENKYTSQNLAPPSTLKTKGDDAASAALNKIFTFSEDSESDYYFTPFSNAQSNKGKWNIADAVGTNDVMLIDRKTNMPVMDGKKRRRFKTGNEFKQEDLDWINNFLSDYVSRPQVDDNTTYTTP